MTSLQEIVHIDPIGDQELVEGKARKSVMNLEGCGGLHPKDVPNHFSQEAGERR